MRFLIGYANARDICLGIVYEMAHYAEITDYVSESVSIQQNL